MVNYNIQSEYLLSYLIDNLLIVDNSSKGES